MKLYYFETPNARKPCAVAKYLGSPVEFVRVDLTRHEQKQPAFLAVNPNGRVPALEDGDFKLWESHAIMCSSRGEPSPISGRPTKSSRSTLCAGSIGIRRISHGMPGGYSFRDT